MTGTRPTVDDNRAPAPLGRLLALRLVVTGAVALVVLAAALVFVYTTQSGRAARHALADAQRHFGARIAQIDADWVRQAELLRGQIEHVSALDADDERLALARLTAFFASMGGQGSFTHCLLLDPRGHVVFRYGTRSRALLPVPPQAPVSWVYADDDRLLYRALRLPLHMGARGRGELVLFAPVDNALLAANAFPGTSISLHWQGRRGLARSDAYHAADPPSGGGELLQSYLHWGEGADAAELHIVRTSVPALLPPEIALVLGVGGTVGALFGWLLIGRWARGHVRRIVALAQAADGYAADHVVTPVLFARIDGAMRGASLELHELAHGLKALITSVADAEAAQRRAQASLRELNATLEQRVEQRTHELAHARDQALAASRAREQFLAGMSHELRTPLVGLLGALEIIDTATLPAAQRRLVEVARRTGDALRAVIDDVLDHAKLEAGQVALRELAFSPADLVREAVSLFAAVALRRGLSLTCHCGDGTEAMVRGDAARLRQVLLNLIGNALKFTDRGRIDVRVERIADHDGRRQLRFAVEDTGIGIEPSLRVALFQPFVQAPDAQAQARGGTGLGLAISQRLVQAMGGWIDVDSQPGRGSSFWFELELPVAQAAPAAAVEVSAAPLRGHVLLVEDNAINRIVAGAMLERLGLQVDEAGDGEQALAALSRGCYDLVLMDCQMPILDGLEATRRIRAGAAGAAAAALPVIAVTANALGGDAERCLAAGMNAYLSKPFREDELAQALAAWLPQRQPDATRAAAAGG